VTFTVKLDSDKRNLMREFCEKSGMKIQKFLANAIEHEVKREMLKEDLVIFEAYEKRGKKTASDMKKFAEELGLKP